MEITGTFVATLNHSFRIKIIETLSDKPKYAG
jgi:hypothetical protein